MLIVTESNHYQLENVSKKKVEQNKNLVLIFQK